MDKVTHNCDNINCNHNDTKGLCCLFNPDNCKYRQLQKENAELKDEVRKLKLLVSSLVYEINQIWDINEMNDDLRRCAEKIDREVHK